MTNNEVNNNVITYKGAFMLGAIIGDIVGSVYEFDNIKTKEFPLFRGDCRFTDDTVCTVAVADIVFNSKDPSETLVNWCRNYPGRGYGDRFTKWFDLPWQEPYNSFGNGAAMRVSPAAFLAESLEEALQSAQSVTEITHNHPEGLKGAKATAHTIYLAKHGIPVNKIRNVIAASYGYDLSRTVDAIREDYDFYESCQKTVPEAIACALEASDFEDAIRNAISIGGDSDTIAAIAGGIAEASFGIPKSIADKALSFLPADMRHILTAVYSQLAGLQSEAQISARKST
ncbi:MAG: ADP-ribosylglycohydrolase family protein [Rhodoferax sp.]|nr:ADP-ribosylglycohydrolase family protein [Rhodoferax sp.]